MKGGHEIPRSTPTSIFQCSAGSASADSGSFRRRLRRPKISGGIIYSGKPKCPEKHVSVISGASGNKKFGAPGTYTRGHAFLYKLP